MSDFILKNIEKKEKKNKNNKKHLEEIFLKQEENCINFNFSKIIKKIK